MNELKKVPVWAWVLLGAAVLYWWYRRAQRRAMVATGVPALAPTTVATGGGVQTLPAPSQAGTSAPNTIDPATAVAANNTGFVPPTLPTLRNYLPIRVGLLGNPTNNGAGPIYSPLQQPLA